MRRTLIFAIVSFILLGSAAFAIPMGGAGSHSYDVMVGTFEVRGQLAVNGLTTFNKQMYVWPKTGVKTPSVLKNNGKNVLSWEDEVSPSGPNGALQVNADGAFYGDESLIFSPETKSLMIGGTPVSLYGHTHKASEIIGVFAQASGGTGSVDGSLAGLGELKLSAGGTNMNVTITPSGTGMAVVNGSGLVSAGPVRTEAGFNVKGTDGFTGTLNIVSDVRQNGVLLQKKMKMLTVTGGIITAISADSDWTATETAATK